MFSYRLYQQYKASIFGRNYMFGQGNEVEAVGMGTALAKPLTVKDKINRAVADAEFQLKQAKRAQEILNKNPELEELLNIMNNSHIFRY